MAIETWSGGQVGSGPGAGGARFGRATGYIPLADIPNAPKTVEMPLAKYQQIPSIRHEYVKQDVDMESRAQKLMQKPLPGSFEEAGEMRVASAGKGQMAWGKAISEAGKEIPKALGNFAESVARLHGEALKSKDATDALRADKNEEWYKLEVSRITKTLPPDQWEGELEKVNKKYAETNSQYGNTPLTRERIGLRTATTLQWGTSSLKTAAAVQSLEKDKDFHLQSINENRQNGKTGDNELHYAELKRTGFYTDDLIKLEKEKDAQVESVGSFNVALQTNPRATMEESERVMRTGEASKDFPHLNKNTAANAFVLARNATNNKDQESYTSLVNQINTDKVIGEKQLRAEAKAMGLPSDDINNLVLAYNKFRDETANNADKNMVLDPAKFVEAKSRVASYDEANDADGKLYKSHVEFILGNVPPAQREMLLSKLNGKTTKSMETKKPEAKARERESDSLTTEIKTLGEKGLQFEDKNERIAFQNAQKDLKDGKKLTPEQLAIWRKGNQWIDDKLNEKDALEAAEPDFAPGDLRTKMREKLAPELQKNIGATQPAAPPRATVTSVAPTRDQLAAAPGIAASSEWVATAPRSTKSESAAFQQAYASEGETFQVHRVTAFTPGKGDPKMEGPNAVSARKGPAFTMEGYERGTFPYVSAAVDPKGELAGKYFISPAYPNVVFKGEDVGRAFEGKGATAFDIAFEDERKATNYRNVTDIEVKVIGEPDALSVSGATRRGVAGLNKQRGDLGTLAGTDQQKIASLKPEAQEKMTSFVSAAKSWGQQNGYEISIAEGYRTPERQAELYAQGRTKPGNIVTNAKPGQSNHQSGRAVDLVVTKNGKVVDDEKVWAQLGKIGQGMGLEWGGTWKSIHDPEHFQVNA